MIYFLFIELVCLIVVFVACINVLVNVIRMRRELTKFQKEIEKNEE